MLCVGERYTINSIPLKSDSIKLVKKPFVDFPTFSSVGTLPVHAQAGFSSRLPNNLLEGNDDDWGPNASLSIVCFCAACAAKWTRKRIIYGHDIRTFSGSRIKGSLFELMLSVMSFISPYKCLRNDKNFSGLLTFAFNVLLDFLLHWTFLLNAVFAWVIYQEETC